MQKRVLNLNFRFFGSKTIFQGGGQKNSTKPQQRRELQRLVPITKLFIILLYTVRNSNNPERFINLYSVYGGQSKVSRKCSDTVVI